MTNSWRALARMARDRIVSSNPSDVGPILELWSLRLTSLARLRLFNQTSAELTNLYSVLTSNSIPTESPLSPLDGRPRGFSPREYLWQKLVPFELEVLHAKTRYWAGDHMSYVDDLVALIARCKRKAREAGEGRKNGNSRPPKLARGSSQQSERAKAREARRKEREVLKQKEREREREMWKERGARVCLILASQLCEMKVSVSYPSNLQMFLTLQAGIRRRRAPPALARPPTRLCELRREAHITAHSRRHRADLPPGGRPQQGCSVFRTGVRTRRAASRA